MSMSMVLWTHFYEWLKMVELVVVEAFGFVEDERTFSMVSSSKSKLQNMVR